MFRPSNMKKLFPVAGAIAIILVAWIFWTKLQPKGLGEGFASGNGRIEATEIDLATKYAGRVVDIFVREGDFVKAGQVLAQMQVDVLNAQRDEARAAVRRLRRLTPYVIPEILLFRHPQHRNLFLSGLRLAADKREPIEDGGGVQRAPRRQLPDSCA